MYININRYIGYFVAMLMSLIPVIDAQAQSQVINNGVAAVTNNSAMIWFNAPGSNVEWVDVHYNKGEGQRDYRLTFNAANSRFESPAFTASAGQSIRYWFTYKLVNGPANDTQAVDTLISGASSAIGSSVASTSQALSSVLQSSSANSQSAGVVDRGNELVIWFNNPYGWTDVHYKLNGAAPESFRMSVAGGDRQEKIIAVTPGSAVKLVYSFTHATATGATSTVDYTYERVINNSSSKSSVAVSSVKSSSVINSVASSSPAISSSASSAVAAITFDADDRSSSVVVWINAPASGWADVHFQLNGQSQQDLRMTKVGSRFEYAVPVTAGAAVNLRYWFNYELVQGQGQTEAKTFMRNATSSSVNSSIANSSTASVSSKSVASSLIASSIASSNGSSVVSSKTSSSAAAGFVQGVSEQGSKAILWFRSAQVMGQDYGNVIAHYIIEDAAGTRAGQIDPRMGFNADLNRWETKIDISKNGTVHYYFTYLVRAGVEDLTPWFDYRFGSGTSAVAKPVFTPAGGNYSSAQSVTLNTDEQNAVIHYTTDGSQPTVASPQYAGEFINVSATTAIKAITVLASGEESLVANEIYVIEAALGSLDAPVFSHSGGTYNNILRVSMLQPTPGAMLHYTLDGTVPTTNSPVYKHPVEMKIDPVKSPDGKFNLQAIAVKNGVQSRIAQANYTITQNTRGEWNEQTKFTIVNATKGKFTDDQVYWAIVGKDWATDKFVWVNSSGQLVPMTIGDNDTFKAGSEGSSFTHEQRLFATKYFHKLSNLRSITIPPINSARLLMSVGEPMYLQINTVAEGKEKGKVAYAGANIENVDDPNISVTFDFGEFAIVPKTDPWQGIYVNTTRVDHFGFPVKLTVTGADGFIQTAGEPLTESRAELFAKFIAAAPAEFRGLAEEPYSPYRIMAPGHADFQGDKANADYLEKYIDEVWKQYSEQPLVIEMEGHPAYTGRVNALNEFVFTDGTHQYKIYGKPKTKDALLGAGKLDDATGYVGDDEPTKILRGRQLHLQAQMAAALNRRVAHLAFNQWHDYRNFFPANERSNFYTKFWHEHALMGLTYGHAYDDVGSYSSSIFTHAPKEVTYTIGW